MPQTSNRQNCHRKLMQGKGTNVEEQRIKRRKVMTFFHQDLILLTLTISVLCGKI
jgi:hypothetical protein